LIACAAITIICHYCHTLLHDARYAAAAADAFLMPLCHVFQRCRSSQRPSLMSPLARRRRFIIFALA